MASRVIRWATGLVGRAAIEGVLDHPDLKPVIVATAMHCVNAVPYACAADPGPLTCLDLPPVPGRAAPGLHRSRSSPT